MQRIVRRIVRSARSEARTIARWRQVRGLIAGASLLARDGVSRLEWLGGEGEVTNPSVTSFQGRAVVLARNVTYRLSRFRQRAVPLAVPVQPQTLVVQAGVGSVLMRQEAGPADEHLEDPRGFEWRGGLWALWSKSKMLGPGSYSNSMVLGRIADGVIGPLVALPSPHDRLREKNWMPLVDGDRLRFVYDLSRLETYEWGVEGLRLDKVEERGVPALQQHSGSSQFVRYRDAWLGVSHRNAMRPRTFPWLPYAYYWHYVVVLNEDLTLREVSKPFFFLSRGVEYCAGIALEGEDLVLSFGVDDARAALLRLPPAALRPLFGPSTASWLSS